MVSRRSSESLPHVRINNSCHRGTRRSRHRRTYIRRYIVVEPTRSGEDTVACARQASPTRALQGIHRGGFEMQYRRAPARRGGHTCTGLELYVKVGRMRILSSPKVVESSELVARRIVDTYLVPNKTFRELREMTIDGSIDLLREFGEACRAEFESLRSQF